MNPLLIFGDRDDALMHLQNMLDLRLEHLGLESKRVDEYLSFLKDPEKIEAFDRENGIENLGPLANSVADILAAADMDAQELEGELEDFQLLSDKIKQQIQATKDLLQLIDQKDYEQVSTTLMERVRELRTFEEIRRNDRAEVQSVTKLVVADKAAPFLTGESTVLEMFATMLLVKGSPKW